MFNHISCGKKKEIQKENIQIAFKNIFETYIKRNVHFTIIVNFACS